MLNEDEQAKANVEEGKDDNAEEKVEVTTPEPAKVESPKSKEGEGEKPSEKLEHRIATVEGMLKKSQDRVNQLEGESRNFEGLTMSIGGLREDLNLVTDVLGHMTTDNEELQEKVAKSRQARDVQTKKQAEAKEAFSQMGTIATIAQMQPNDEALKPAMDAYGKGEFKQAINLTTLAVQSKVSSLQVAKPVEKSEPEAEKKKLSVNTSSPAPSSDWREQTSKNKITDGLKDKRNE